MRSFVLRLGEELRVEVQRVVVLLGHLEVREDHVDRARLHAGVAVDAQLGIDVELLRGLEIGCPRLRVDAVDWTDLDAGVVLDAASGDHVRHGPTGYKAAVYVLRISLSPMSSDPSRSTALSWNRSVGQRSSDTRRIAERRKSCTCRSRRPARGLGYDRPTKVSTATTPWESSTLRSRSTSGMRSTPRTRDASHATRTFTSLPRRIATSRTTTHSSSSIQTGFELKSCGGRVRPSRATPPSHPASSPRPRERSRDPAPTRTGRSCPRAGSRCAPLCLPAPALFPARLCAS